jgi:F-type H+-transporting ATPase subunit epsilon
MILEIVSPEAKLFSGEITAISLPGVDGHFQMFNNHAPIVSPSFKFSKESENLFTKVNDQNFTIAIQSGTIEMKDNKVIVLAD